MPGDIWEAWEDYMGKELSETRLRYLWHVERGYYSPGFCRFVDLKVGIRLMRLLCHQYHALSLLEH